MRKTYDRRDKVYRMRYDICDYRFLTGDNMIVTDPDEWKKKVFEYVNTYYQRFIKSYTEDTDKPYEEKSFQDWVKWCLRETVHIDSITLDDYPF